MGTKGIKHYRLQVFSDGYSCINSAVIEKLTKEKANPYEMGLCLLLAHMKVFKPLDVGTRTGVRTLQKHQVLTSLNDLKKRLGWSKDTLLGALRGLEAKGIIETIEKGQGGTILEFVESVNRSMPLAKAVDMADKVGLSGEPRTPNQVDMVDLIPANQVDMVDLIPGPSIYKRNNNTKELPRLGKAAAADLKSVWNENCGELKKVHVISPQHQRAWLSRWSEEPDREYWANIVRKMAQSDFCLGRVPRRDGSRPFIASLAFFLKPGTHEKVFAGDYDNLSGPTDKWSPVARR